MEAMHTMHAHAHTLEKLAADFFITNVCVTIRMPEVSSTSWVKRINQATHICICACILSY